MSNEGLLQVLFSIEIDSRYLATDRVFRYEGDITDFAKPEFKLPPDKETESIY